MSEPIQLIEEWRMGNDLQPTEDKTMRLTQDAIARLPIGDRLVADLPDGAQVRVARYKGGRGEGSSWFRIALFRDGALVEKFDSRGARDAFKRVATEIRKHGGAL